MSQAMKGPHNRAQNQQKCAWCPRARTLLTALVIACISVIITSLLQIAITHPDFTIHQTLTHSVQHIKTIITSQDDEIGDFTEQEQTEILLALTTPAAPNTPNPQSQPEPTIYSAFQSLRTAGYFPVAISNFNPVQAVPYDELHNYTLPETPQFATKDSGSRIVYVYVHEK